MTQVRDISIRTSPFFLHVVFLFVHLNDLRLQYYVQNTFQIGLQHLVIIMRQIILITLILTESEVQTSDTNSAINIRYLQEKYNLQVGTLGNILITTT